MAGGIESLCPPGRPTTVQQIAHPVRKTEMVPAVSKDESREGQYRSSHSAGRMHRKVAGRAVVAPCLGHQHTGLPETTSRSACFAGFLGSHTELSHINPVGRA